MKCLAAYRSVGLTIVVGLRDLVFFFQAEDGIRDIGVTGVQTCALPIYEHGDGEIAGLEDIEDPRHHNVQVRRKTLPLRVAVRLQVRPLVIEVEGQARDGQIGRASCRERVEIAAVGGSVKEKTETSERGG